MNASYVVKRIGALSRRWLEPKFSFRRQTISLLSRRSGFPVRMAENIIDTIFCELTAKNIHKLLCCEFGDPKVLDAFQKNPITGIRHRVLGPRQITHIFSGNVPHPAIFSFVFGMLLGSRNIGKVSSENAGFLDVYLASLRNHDRQLAGLNSLISNRNPKVLEREMARADLVVAYGSDQTLETIRGAIKPQTRFIGYGHKMSFSYYAREILTSGNFRSLVQKTAEDLWMVHQQGCLSPIAVFIEKGAKVSGRDFAASLFEHLERLGGKPVKMALNAKDYFNIYRIKRPQTEIWQKNWIVFLDESSYFPENLGCGAVCVKTVQKKEDAGVLLRPFRRHLQALALEAPRSSRVRLAGYFSELGFNRIARAGRMQSPPIFWHHDGRPNLSDWVNWADLE